jgi:hypothetical protein
MARTKNPNELKYRAVVLGNTLARSKVKSTPSIKLKMKAILDENTGKSMNQIIYHDLWLSFKMKERTDKVLREVFGWRGSSYADFNDPVFLEGKNCILVGELNEEGYFQVIFVNSVSGFAPLTDSELDAFLEDVSGSSEPVIEEGEIAF